MSSMSYNLKSFVSSLKSDTLSGPPLAFHISTNTLNFASSTASSTFSPVEVCTRLARVWGYNSSPVPLSFNIVGFAIAYVVAKVMSLAAASISTWCHSALASSVSFA